MNPKKSPRKQTTGRNGAKPAKSKPRARKANADPVHRPQRPTPAHGARGNGEVTPPDWSLLCEQAKELIQRLECAFFTGRDLTAVIKLQELAVFTTQTLHDCWSKSETVPHHKWTREFDGTTLVPRDIRQEVMKHAVTMEPFPILHHWPSLEVDPLMEQEKKAQADMLARLARTRLKTPGKKDNVVAPLVAEFLGDLHAHFANPFVRPDSWPAGSLERRMWECLEHEPRTKEEVKNWADVAAECLIQKAENHDKFLMALEDGTLSSPPNVDMRKHLKGGRLKPDGDLYRVANPSIFAEKDRADREDNLPTHEEQLRPQGTISDEWRKVELGKFREAASTATVTDAHIEAGLVAAFVRYFKTKIPPPTKD